MRLILKPRRLKLLLLAMCLHTSPSTLALTTDKEQPINLESDMADIDDNSGISIYKGNVIVTQGSIRVTGDSVTLNSPERKLNKVVVVGKPARYSQRPDDAAKDMRAQGAMIEYYVNTNQLVLIEGAHVWNVNNDEISGSRIDFDLKAGLGRAVRGEKDRVRVIIQPTSAQTARGGAKSRIVGTTSIVTRHATSEASHAAPSIDAPAENVVPDPVKP